MRVGNEVGKSSVEQCKPGFGETGPAPVLRRASTGDVQRPRRQHVALGAGLPVQPHALNTTTRLSRSIRKQENSTHRRAALV